MKSQGCSWSGPMYPLWTDLGIIVLAYYLTRSFNFNRFILFIYFHRISAPHDTHTDFGRACRRNPKQRQEWIRPSDYSNERQYRIDFCIDAFHALTWAGIPVANIPHLSKYLPPWWRINTYIEATWLEFLSLFYWNDRVHVRYDSQRKLSIWLFFH